MKANSIRFFTHTGMNSALQNLWYPANACSVVEIDDAVEDARDAQDLVKRLNQLRITHKFQLDRETEAKVRLRNTDSFGNVSYLEVLK